MSSLSLLIHAGGLRALVIANKLYLVGGWNSGIVDTVYELKDDGSDWIERVDLKLDNAISGHAAVAYYPS